MNLHVELEQPRPGVRILRLNRPDRLNALNLELLDAVIGALEEIDTDADCRVLIVTGAGRAFCAGSDLDGAREREGDGVAANLVRQQTFASLPTRLRNLEVPVIAAVNGPCVGAGFGIALGADIRVAAESASFHVGAIKRGLSGGECGMSYALPRAIGTSRAFEVLLTGRPIEAEEAERIGLVSRLTADAELIPTALEIAGEIIANSPFGVSMTKAVCWSNLDHNRDAAIDLENRTQILTSETEDFGEALRAWQEKREPVFKGR
jgi:enoyl-CoA hydratase